MIGLGTEDASGGTNSVESGVVPTPGDRDSAGLPRRGAGLILLAATEAGSHADRAAG